MCLAIPAKILTKEDFGLADVEILGVTRSVALDLVPQAQVGDYILVHAGFGIEVIDEAYAQETLDLIRQLPALAGENATLLPDDFSPTNA